MSVTDDYLMIGFVLLWFVALAGLMFIVGSGKLRSADDDFETRRLYFAATILGGLALLFLFAMGIYTIGSVNSGPKKEVFDTVKTIVPPIVTLVLGYYFGQEKGKPGSVGSPDAPVRAEGKGPG